MALSLLKVRAKMSLDLMFLPKNIDFCIVRTYSILKKFLTLINMAVLKTFLKVFISFLLMFHAVADPGWDQLPPAAVSVRFAVERSPWRRSSSHKLWPSTSNSKPYNVQCSLYLYIKFTAGLDENKSFLLLVGEFAWIYMNGYVSYSTLSFLLSSSSSSFFFLLLFTSVTFLAC